MRYPTTKHVTDDMVAKIDLPLDAALVSSRQAGGSSTVSYVKGDIVADQLNKVFGPLGWGLVAKVATTEHWEEEKSVRRNNQATDVKMHMVMVLSDVTLTVKAMTPDGSETVFTQPGIGYGDVEVGKSRKDAYSMAVKGAATDGLKRCASLIGKSFGMMMASNGSQEDVDYAHSSNPTALNKARGMRRNQTVGNGEDRSRGDDRARGDDRGRMESDSHGGGDRQDRGREDARRDDRPRERAESGADNGRQASRQRQEAEQRQDAPSRQEGAARQEPAQRQDNAGRREGGPRHDDTSRGEKPVETSGNDGNAQNAGDTRKGVAEPAASDAAKPKAKTGVRTASTDFNLESLPVSQQEMTDFAATLIERVKELRQEGDRKALVKQHTNTIRNLDSKIRARLIERLAEAGVEDDMIRA